MTPMNERTPLKNNLPLAAVLFVILAITSVVLMVVAKRSPDIGIAAGKWRRNSRSERVIRRAGTFASASACAVRRTMRSWKENCQAPREPRAGATKPAAISDRIVPRDRRSNRSTSRMP